MSGAQLKTFTRYALTIILPVVIATTSAISAANHGPVRVYWALGAIASTLGLALLNTYKEINTKKTRLLTETSQQKLRIALAEASQPLVTAVGLVCSATDVNRKQEAVRVLMALAIKTVRAQCGVGSRASYRSCFYSLVDNGLLRVLYEGREGDAAPRQRFDLDDSDEERRLEAHHIVQIARGEDSLFIEDMYSKPPAYMARPNERGYRTMIAVPVNAGDQRFGLLSIDSPEQYTLKDIDRRYIILVAGVLAAGLAVSKGSQ